MWFTTRVYNGHCPCYCLASLYFVNSCYAIFFYWLWLYTKYLTNMCMLFQKKVMLFHAERSRHYSFGIISMLWKNPFLLRNSYLCVTPLFVSERYFYWRMFKSLQIGPINSQKYSLCSDYNPDNSVLSFSTANVICL